jgi:hypothetical protein
MSALAYAIKHQMPLPTSFRVISHQLPESGHEKFAAFCRNLPKEYGPYTQ